VIKTEFLAKSITLTATGFEPVLKFASCRIDGCNAIIYEVYANVP